MPKLLDLPNELLDRIIGSVRPPDLQALALTNKSIHGLMQNALQRHLWCRRNYSLVRVGYHDRDPSPPPDECYHALLFLAKILEDPNVAHYPTTLTVGGCGSEDGDYDDLDDEDVAQRQRAVAQHSDSLRDIVKSCHLLPPERNDQSANSICNPLNEDAALCMLLSLLPNLREIEIDDLLHDRRFLDMVQRAALANWDSESSSHKTALNHLKEIYLLRNENPYGMDIQYFAPFAMLPSIRRLRGFNIDGDTFAWPCGFSRQSSTLTHIEMVYSAASAQAFDGLLKGVAALKSFVYEYDGPGELGSDYEPVGIIRALRTHAAHSLELMEVQGQSGAHSDEWEGKAVGSLREFARLRSICLEDTIFQIPKSYNEFASLEAGKTLRDPTDVESERLQDGELRIMGSLVEILPASVQGFTLVQLMDDEDTRDLLEDMAELKAEKLPKLKRLTVKCPNPFEDEMRDALKAAGIKLYSWGTPL
ncbi:MAG: hypothetical protein LQ350_005428 [Teloschistes chrysophthalmus]|nr:MAG: hypothetical protein LQ350_005428 [Niorma chrysophthalma]